MAERTIRTGVGTYLGAAGQWQFGMFGETVDVHDDDLERFDRLNPAQAEVVVDVVEEDEPPAPSESWKKDELIAYAVAHGLDISEAGTKADILAVIGAADAAANGAGGDEPPADDEPAK